MCLALSGACTITVPIAAGIATSAHNRKVKRAKAAGQEPAPKQRSVGGNILAGALIGAFLDVLVLFSLAASIDDGLDSCE